VREAESADGDDELRGVRYRRGSTADEARAADQAAAAGGQIDGDDERRRGGSRVTLDDGAGCADAHRDAPVPSLLASLPVTDRQAQRKSPWSSHRSHGGQRGKTSARETDAKMLAEWWTSCRKNRERFTKSVT